MRTYDILHVIENQKDPYYASIPGIIINFLSRTNFHGSKGVRAIEVQL